MNIGHYEKLGQENNLVLFLESTNAEEPGLFHPRKSRLPKFGKNRNRSKKENYNRNVSSHIERVIEIVKVAEKHDKKVAIDGYSLKSSFEIIKALGYFNPKKMSLSPLKK